jgi:16S rRNA (cytosine967-C5)-methyltransferase
MSAVSRRPRNRSGVRPRSARETALYVLYQVDTRKAFADLQLNRALDIGALDPRDAALATELVNGTLRWRARLDWILGHYVRTGLDTVSPWIRNILRLGLYQIVFLDRVPPHAAVDESVKLARKYGHAGTAGLVNAVLRRLARETDSLPDPERKVGELPLALSLGYSHPQWLVERWLRRLGEEETRALLAADNRPSPLCLRINPLRTDRETVRSALGERGIEAEVGELSRLTLRVRQNLVPRDLPEFAAGWIFVQDESETLVGELLAPEPGETVLDICAAPGGKTTQIQEGRGGDGRVIAVDLPRNRLSRIVENIARLDLSGVDVVQADGRNLALAHPVDRVLVDAPCSGLGVLSRRADARWRKTEASMRQLLPLQGELLAGGASHVRPGGVLVYSVCSNEPEEGRNQVGKFLKGHPEFVLEDAAAWLPSATVTEGCLLLYPHQHGTDGVFAARMRKTE